MGYIRKLNDSVNIIGTNLRKYRIQNNYSQEDLCKKLALLWLTMFQPDIYEIENNKRLVKDFELKAFCMALNISADDLLRDTEKFFD